MDEADRLCDRIGIIDHGRIIALDSPERLRGSLGGDVVKLRMARPSAKPFEGLRFVKGAEVKGNEVVLTVEDSSSHLAELLQRVDGVEHVELHTPTLNDVFLKYTGREMREESGDGGFLADYQASQRGH
jgi:ABC-2 type transport system ATP-binding protein